jgi:hypothetical protein
MIESDLHKYRIIAEVERTDWLGHSYFINQTDYRQRCTGKFVKPPYGAFVKSNGTQRYGQSKCNQLYG